MKIEHHTAGINPTAEFIENQHTGKFVEILPGTYLIKGAKNDRGFDQAYALSNSNKKELLLIDVVEEASREAVKTIVKDNYKIKAILITGQSVLNDAYDTLDVLSEEAGGAAIYLHRDIKPDGNNEIKKLINSDALLSSSNLEIFELPQNKDGAVLIYSSKNGGMLFTGDSAKGSAYNTDSFLFTRNSNDKHSEEFEIAGYWEHFRKEFTYLFPRMGKPAIEVDDRTRRNILNWLKGINKQE